MVRNLYISVAKGSIVTSRAVVLARDRTLLTSCAIDPITPQLCPTSINRRNGENPRSCEFKDATILEILIVLLSTVELFRDQG